MIRMFHFNDSLTIKNCTFEQCDHIFGNIKEIISGEVSSGDVTINFEDCNFYNNTVSSSIMRLEYNYYQSCVHPTNTTLILLTTEATF